MVKAKRKNKKLYFLKILLFLLSITSYGLLVTSYELFAQDKIIAIVNKDVITQKDFNDFLNFMRVQLSTDYRGKELETKIQSMKLDLLDKLIEDRLILQEAKKNNLKTDENRVKGRVEEIKRHYQSDKEFQDDLAKQGLVQADIELKIREQLLTYAIIDIKIRSKIIVNPAEVTDFYQENKERFKLPEGREFESITIDNANLADQIYANIKKGEDFKGVAERYSLSVNKLNTWDSQLRKDIEEKIFSLQIGEISMPTKIENNFYIFRLNNILPSRQQNLSSVQDQIYTFLFNKKMEEELASWLENLKKHAYIKILQN